jgi:flagellar M-ring protein FliF
MRELLKQLRKLGSVRLAALAGVGVAVLGLLAWLALRASSPPMALLYGELEQRDAAGVVAALERARIPHIIGGGGTQIFVPEEQVPRVRLQLAREGLPAGGSVGYELFDRGESLTTTPFQQDINRLRALEGELSRTIRGLAGVRAARVHLVLPHRQPFSRERGEAQASVVLTMHGAQRLDREGVQAVLHLVSAAVPGLRPQSVSIVDSRGEVLARGGQAVAGGAAAATQEEMKRAQELRLQRAVEDLLSRSLGAGRVRAEATVEMDFDRVQTTEERFDPDNQVPRSQQSSTETTRSGQGGNVSVANQLPGAEAAQGGDSTEESRQDETINYEIGRSTRSTVREHPMVRRISVAVLVDGVWEPPAGGGAPRFRERTPEELARIAALARSAVGFDERRGDRVEVVSMQFADPPGTEAGSGGGILGLGIELPPSATARLLESAVLALVALAAILLVGRPVAGKLAATLAPRSVAAAESVAALPGAAATALPAVEEDGMVSLANVEGQLRVSSLKRLGDLVERHPDETLAVLRRWLLPENA